jgi:ATP-dependent 26S proteasome regulatory subunit
MGRVNIELPEELHREMKVACAQHSLTIIEFIENAIDYMLKKRG